MTACCSNTNASGMSTFNFSKNEEVRSQVNYAGVTNKSQMDDLLTNSTILCSDHLEESCFEAQQKVPANFGTTMRSRLKSGAVPSKPLS